MGWLTDLLKEYPALSVAKERLSLLQDKMQTIENENVKLKEENRDLKAQVNQLKKDIDKYTKEAVFVEGSGVCFKKKTDGNFEIYAYCPSCKQAMSEFPPQSDEMLLCSKCNYRAPFPPSKLGTVRSQVALEYYKHKKDK